ncbi:MAG: hypothetical protein Q9219_005735, partial [cf. Caloplaca sp. 3 TL-2023]
VVMTGILRMVLIFQPRNVKPNGQMCKVQHVLMCILTDITGDVNRTQGQIWTNIHLGTAILCASLPTFPSLMRNPVAFCNDTVTRLSSKLSLRTVKINAEEQGKSDKGLNTYKHLDASAGDKKFLTKTTAIRSESWNPEDPLEMGKIIVRDTFDVV